MPYITVSHEVEVVVHNCTRCWNVKGWMSYGNHSRIRYILPVWIQKISCDSYRKKHVLDADERLLIKVQAINACYHKVGQVR